MVNHDYFLIGHTPQAMGKGAYKVIDRAVYTSIREAQKDFRSRNNFEKLLKKYNLTIARTERWFS